jgi:hypothetical protein
VSTFTTISLGNDQTIGDPLVSNETHHVDDIPVVPRTTSHASVAHDGLSCVPGRVGVLSEIGSIHFPPSASATPVCNPGIQRFNVPIGTNFARSHVRPRGTRTRLVWCCRWVMSLQTWLTGKQTSKKNFLKLSSKRSPLAVVLRMLCQSIVVVSLGVLMLYFVVTSFFSAGTSMDTVLNNDVNKHVSVSSNLPPSTRWSVPFVLFDDEALALKDFQGIGEKLDALLNSDELEMCATGAELGLPVPYLVLRGIRKHHANRHYVNALVTFVTSSTDDHGRKLNVGVQWRTEVATHCQFHKESIDMDLYEKIVDVHVARSKQRDEDKQATTFTRKWKAKNKQAASHLHTKSKLSADNGGSTSFLWHLHLSTQNWLSNGEEGAASKKEPVSQSMHSDALEKSFLTRKRKRFTKVLIDAIDGATGKPIQHTLTGNDAFCAQAYHEIARGEWPCVSVDMVSDDKSEL